MAAAGTLKLDHKVYKWLHDRASHWRNIIFHYIPPAILIDFLYSNPSHTKKTVNSN